MDGTAVLSKTAKGVDEVTRHAHGLPNRLRSLLIMVNGHATAAALIAKVGEAAETKSSLQYLIDRGFVEDSRIWDPALLEQIEAHFTRFVGPIAKIMVRRAQEEASDLEELYTKLADKLELTDERVKFMTTRTRVLPRSPRLRSRDTPPPARAGEPRGDPVRLEQMAPSQRLQATPLKGALPRALGKPPSEPRNASPGRGVELLDEIEHHFAQFMGSSAKPIVRLARKHTTSVDQLYAILSRMLDSPHDRLAFIATRRQLYVPLLRRTMLHAQGAAGIKASTRLDRNRVSGNVITSNATDGFRLGLGGPPFPVVSGDDQKGTLEKVIGGEQIEARIEDPDDTSSVVNGKTFFVIDMGTGAMISDISL